MGFRFVQADDVILYFSSRLTAAQNFTEVVLGEPLRRGFKRRKLTKYSDFHRRYFRGVRAYALPHFLEWGYRTHTL